MPEKKYNKKKRTFLVTRLVGSTNEEVVPRSDSEHPKIGHHHMHKLFSSGWRIFIGQPLARSMPTTNDHKTHRSTRTQGLTHTKRSTKEMVVKNGKIAHTGQSSLI